MDQQVTRLVVIRHGETDWNAGQRVQGHTDIELNPLGVWQAERMAEALADEGVQAIYSSDLRRARATAEALARRVGLPVQVAPGLREREFGSFEGLTFAEIDARWPAEALRWRGRDPAFAPPEGGEALTPFYRRVVDTGETLAARHRGQLVALVAHGGVLDCLYRAAARVALDAPRSWMLGNATINRLLHSDQGFTLVGWNDAAHLSLPPAG